MILITGGMKDHMLTEKAVAYTYSLKQVIFANIHRMEEKLFQGGDMDARINYLQAELKIMKRGKYSGRSTHEDNKGDKCKKCTYKYRDGRCPADRRKYNV